MPITLYDRHERKLATWAAPPSARELAYAIAQHLDVLAHDGTLCVIRGYGTRALVAVNPWATGEETRTLMSLPGRLGASAEDQLVAALGAWARLKMGEEGMRLE